MQIIFRYLVFSAIVLFNSPSMAIQIVFGETDFNTGQKVLIRGLLEDLIDSEFSRIDSKPTRSITIYQMNRPGYFLESNFKLTRFTGAPSYKIGISPTVFDENIPTSALQAILAHELVHTEEYIGKSALGLIGIGLGRLGQRNRAHHERMTDLKTIAKGFAPGLMDFRIWQYPLLDSEQLQKKQHEYFTPAEIEYARITLDKNPELFEWWLDGHVPLSIDAMLDDIQEHQ
ncbi:MAG: hypothetical protein R2827_13385 [Bdellovibrionales bacterium]